MAIRNDCCCFLYTRIMKLRLTPSLFRAVISALSVASVTVAAVSSSLYAASLSNSTLTLSNGDNAAIRMSSATPDTTYSGSNAGRYSCYDSNKGDITYSSSSSRFSNGTAFNNMTVSAITLNSGSALYLYSTDLATDFRGTININNATGNHAVIGTSNATAADVVIGTLSGSGNLLLRGHNTSSSGTTTTTFTFNNSEAFSGTVFMTANGGAVQVNASGAGWQNAVVDFTRNADYSDSLIDSTGSAPSKQTLNLTSDASVKGLQNGTATYANVSGAYTLTLGYDGAEEYIYGGALDAALGLKKVGSNTQAFSGAITVENLEILDGKLATRGGATIERAVMHGDATWVVGGTTKLSELSLTGGSASIQGYGNNVVWTAPSVLSLDGFSSSTDPFLLLDNVTLQFDNELEVNDLHGDAWTVGSVVNFAQLSNGSSYTGIESLMLIQNGNYYDFTHQVVNNTLQFTITGIMEAPPDLIVNGIAAIYISDDGKTASGNTVVSRSGYRNYIYSVTNNGSINAARWQTSDGSTDASYWIGEGNEASTTWHGTSADGISDELEVIQLSEGNALYLGGNDYKGTILLKPGNATDAKATIASYSPSTTEVSIAKLKGVAEENVDILFLGTNTSGTTTFTVENAVDYSGAVYMSSNGGAVQVNIAGDGWQNSVFDFTRNADLSDSAIDGSGSVPSKQTLNLTSDASVKGLQNGGSYAYVSGNHTLTVGQDDAGEYSYGGQFDSVSLVKHGNNTQVLSGNAELRALTVLDGCMQLTGTSDISGETILSGGTLDIDGNMTTGTYTHEGNAGSLDVAAAASMTVGTAMNLSNGAQDTFGGKLILNGTGTIDNASLIVQNGISGTGNLVVKNNGSILAVGGTLQTAGLQLIDGTVYTVGSTSFDGVVEQSGGELKVDGVFAANSYTHTGGTLAAAGNVRITSVMTLNGVKDSISGTLTAGDVLLQNGAQLDVQQGSSISGKLSIENSSARFIGALNAGTLSYTSGSLYTGADSHVRMAELAAGTTWYMSENTTLDNITLIGVNEQENAVLSGGSVSITSGITANSIAADQTWFTLDNINFSLSSGSVLRGVDVSTETATITFAQLSGNSLFSCSGNAVTVYSENGVKYDGAIRMEDNVVYIDLSTAWQDLIWSGVANGTTINDADHLNGELVMGSVWRADGSAENTGWHEQNVGGGAGVFVNGRDVVFADTNYHGSDVGGSYRKVEIIGKVAADIIRITADTESGLISNNGEARLQFGYAFYSNDEVSGIVDYTDSYGVVTPTKIIKEGEAMLVLNTNNSFSGGVDVLNGGLYLATPGAAGIGTINVHTDNTWQLPVWNSVNNKWNYDDKVGAELMVCYLHSNEHASAFRSGTVTNDIVMMENDASSAGRLTISFAMAGFNLSGTDDHANVPRHWRNLTLSGALVGTGNKQDELVLTGYSSTWSNYRDQSYVTSFMLNERTKSSEQIISNFNGSVKLKNTINASPLSSNCLDKRTAGSVQVILQDNKLQYAHMDLTRESVVMPTSLENNSYDGLPRQTYNNILVLNGEVGLRGLSAEFLGSGYYYEWDGVTSWGGSSDRSYVSLEQNEEVWHVRTVANATATLTLGVHEDDADAVYVYSGAMGFAQSYVEPTQAAVMWGDGFDVPPTSADDSYIVDGYGVHSMGKELLSVVKKSTSSQYIHSAKLDDVAVDAGVLGFNNLELLGSLTLVSGAKLELGVSGTVGKQTWDKIEADTQSDLLSADLKSYEVAPTSPDVVISSGNILTVYTDEPDALPGTAAYVPSAAVVDGNITMSSGSGLLFDVNKVEPWFHTFPDGMDLTDYTAANPLPDGTHGASSNMLLDVNGTLSLMSNTSEMELRFRGVNFSLSPFSDRLYYLAEADNITIGGADSSEFASRLISLGYGYFGVVDTLDSSNAGHNTDGKDYLVMTVVGDPRHTWSGASELTEGAYTWTSYSGREDVPMMDYHWKENTAFLNGHVVLFGNLYNPEAWEQRDQLTSDDTVRVLTSGTIDTEYGSDLDGDFVLLSGNVATNQLEINGLNEKEKFGTDYQMVNIAGEVAPLSFIIGSEYLDVTSGEEQVAYDDTNYWFFSADGSGTIRDANDRELSDMFHDSSFDGGEWLTNLEKYGDGTAVIATANSFSGGTKLYGGKIVMQHAEALGDGAVYITNGAALQGDFADDREALDWPGYEGAYVGEGMLTSTVTNLVDVRLNYDPDDIEHLNIVDARIVNAYDKKMVLTELIGAVGSVVTLHGISIPVEDHSTKYTYAVFKVLDPSAFYGTIRMDGNLWGAPREAEGGNVQMEIMTTDKSTILSGLADDSSKKDWLNTNIDLSVNSGTNRTVLALDAIECFADGSDAPEMQEALVNSLNGSGDIRMADGAINSSVVNMSEHKHITLVIKGLKSGSYDGVLGYGDFQRTTEYGTEHRDDIPQVGETCHHYGCSTFGDLSVRKEGSGTTQSVYNAWLHTLEVTGGTFEVKHALQVENILSGDGTRVFVGSVSDLNTIYALTVGNGGILSMDTRLYEDASGKVKYDSLSSLSAGANNESAGGDVGWVNLQDGAVITAHTDWYTKAQVEIDAGSTVTFNTHNFTPDPFITSDHSDHAHIDENGEAHEHFNHFNSSHIIQLLGKISGTEVNLIFNNRQMSPGANAQERGGADYMGYVAINNHNAMTGSIAVYNQTMLQVLGAGSQSDMDVSISGYQAGMQLLDSGKTQYVDMLTVNSGGALHLGGVEKTSLGSGENALTEVDYAAENIRLSVTNRYGRQDGTMNAVYTDLSGKATRIGGTNSEQTNAYAVRMIARSAEGTHEVHDMNLTGSLLQLEAAVSVDVSDDVFIDRNSCVFGEASSLLAEQATLSGDFSDIIPQASGETLITGSNTTIELTVHGGTIVNAAGSMGDKKVYHAYTTQLKDVNVQGDGVTINLTDMSFFSEAHRMGADFIAVQIEGSGEFRYEETLDSVAFEPEAWKLYNVQGSIYNEYWLSSSQIMERYGVSVSSSMLYFMVPEPTTATLSLLALSMLASRRRRK